MKTINDLLQEASGYDNVVKQIERDDRIEAYYKRFPELERIDSELMDTRRKRLLAAMDRDDTMEEACDIRENELRSRRDEYIRENRIDPEFDELKEICSQCHDTGFKQNARGTRVVCDCRKKELLECYDLSGMADYSTYTLSRYDKKFGEHPGRRNAVLNSMMNVVLGKDNRSLFLYSDTPGSGKTFLAVCMAKAAIKMGRSALFCRCEDIAGMDDDELADCKNCDLLLIDDFSGEITLKAAVGSNLNNILESRLATGRPTVLVSIYKRDALIGESDVRIGSKLQKAEVL